MAKFKIDLVRANWLNPDKEATVTVTAKDEEDASRRARDKMKNSNDWKVKRVSRTGWW